MNEELAGLLLFLVLAVLFIILMFIVYNEKQTILNYHALKQDIVASFRRDLEANNDVQNRC